MRKLTNKEVLTSLNYAHDGFMISDPKGTILYFNTAYARLTKLFDLVKVGSSIREFVDSGIIKGASCLVAAQQKRTVTQLHLDDVSGAAIICAAKPCFDESNHVTRVITNVRDITEFFDLRKQIEDVQHIVANFAEQMEQAKDYGEGIIAIDQRMCAVLDLAQKVSGVDVTVLIQGESGTGKEVLARFIHCHSPRQKMPFLAVNCGAIPESLLETELFGYAEGTFTGQLRGGKAGLLKNAEHGTLFLDEIGDMPLQMQVKLLRMLESGTYSPVGSAKVVECDVRILSATNKDLQKMVAEGTFREDLYYRLNVVQLKLPALRDRSDDIIPLALYFLEKYNLKYHCNKTLSPPVLKQMHSYSWPGNVRELRNAVERMLVLSPGKNLVLTPDIQNAVDLPKLDFFPTQPQGVRPLNDYIAEQEREYLLFVYRQCGTTRKMAQALQVDHSTIIRKMKKYGISATK